MEELNSSSLDFKEIILDGWYSLVYKKLIEEKIEFEILDEKHKQDINFRKQKEENKKK